MSTLNWLENWYKNNCDGYWEHQYGVKITNIDNPGWRVQINVHDIKFEDKNFEDIKYDNGDSDWYVCTMNNKIFDGCGDPDKLEIIINKFKDCIES